MKPNKKQALKLLGLMCICQGGKMSKHKAKDIIATFDGIDILNTQYDWTFSEEGMRNLIIDKKDGSQIVIPFSYNFDLIEDSLKGSVSGKI